jgi:hypothetical protein
MHRFCILPTIVGLIVVSGQGTAQVNSSWNGGTGNWSTASQWTPGTFAPNNGNGGNTYNATIANGGIVTRDIAITIQALTLGGHITGNSDLTTNGLLTLDSGSRIMGTGVVNANGGVLIQGLGISLLGTTLNNAGTASLARSLGSETGCIWNNLAGSVFSITGDAGLSLVFGAPVFNNSGTFRKETSTGTSTSNIEWAFNNNATGTLAVAAGTVALNGGGTWQNGATISVPFNATANTTLQFTGGAFTLGNTTANNDGTINFGSASGVTLNGTYTHTGAGTTVIGGSTTFNGTSNFGTTNIYSALGGSGTITVSGVLTMTGGSMVGTGTTIVNGTMTLNTNSPSSVFLGRILTNNSTITHLGDAGLAGQSTAVINNSAGALFDLRTPVVMGQLDVTPATFNNAGTLRRSTNGGTAIFQYFLNSTAGSIVEVTAGNLSLAKGGTISSTTTLTAASGSTLGLDSAFTLTPGASFTGAGTLRFGGTVTVPAGSLTIAGAAGTNDTGNLASNGSTTLQSTFSWDAGAVTGSGSVTATGVVTVTGQQTPSLHTTFNNTNSMFVARSLIASGSATLNNAVGATFEIGPSATLAVFSGIPVFNNNGSLVKLSGTNDSAIDWQFNTTSTASMSVSNAKLSFTGGGTWASGTTIATSNGATMAFTGGVFTTGNLTVNNSGGIQFATNSFTVNGTYTQTGTGSTSIGQTVNFNGTSNVQAVALFGTWSGSGAVTVNGTITWGDAATLSGTGTTTANGNITINFTGNPGTLSRTLNNNATATVTGNLALQGTSTAVINNGTTGVFDFQQSAGLSANAVTPIFNNSGIVKKTTANVGAVITWQFNSANGSIVAAEAGTLSLTGGGTISSGTSLTAGIGYTVGLDGPFTVQPGTTFTGAGLLRKSGAITVTSGTLAIAGSSQVSGTIGGAGAITYNGNLNWTNGGTFNNTGGVIANGSVLVDGLNRPNLGTALTTNSTTNFTRSVGGNAAALWTNPSSGAITISSDGGFAVIAGVPVLNNSGNISKTVTSGGETFVGWQFNQTATGSLGITAGQINLAGGGTWATGSTVGVGTGTTLLFSSGSYSLGNLATTNTGAVTAGGASITTTTTFTVPGQFNLTAGTLTNNGTSSYTTVGMTGGTWQGTGAVAIGGVLTWTGGTQSGTGTTTANGGITLNAGTPNLARPLVNNGTATMSATATLQGSTGGSWTNAAGQLFNIQNNNNLTLGSGTVVFTNNGIFRKSNANGTSSVAWQLDNAATGQIDLQQGTLTLQGGGSHVSGAVTTVATGTSLNFAGGTFTLAAGANVNSTGTLRFGASGATTTFAATLSHTGLTEFTGGTTSFNTVAYSLNAVNQTAGTWRGSSNVTIGGLFSWSGGSLLSGGGSTTANGNSNIGNAGDVTLARTLNNASSAALIGATGNFIGNPGAVLNNTATGTFDIQVNKSLTVTAGLPVPSITNAGTFQKSVLTGTTNIAWNMTNTGTVRTLLGTMNFNGTTTNTGTFTATSGSTIGGTITTNTGGVVNGGGTYSGTATINSGGRIAPGNATTVDVLTVGTSTINSGGIYRWKIADAGPNAPIYSAIANTATSSTGSGYQDTITVQGNLNWTNPVIEIVGLAGNGFDNTKAYSWAIATYNGTTGTVTNPSFTTSGLSPGSGSFDLTVVSNTVVVNFNPVPEPTSALAVALLAGLSLRRYRALVAR